MNDNVVRISPKSEGLTVSDVTSAAYEPFRPLTITARVGEYGDENSFEIIIIFAEVVRFDHASLPGDILPNGFERVNQALEGFYVSETSSYLQQFKATCDDGFKEDALSAMWHYHLSVNMNSINIISQRDPRLLKQVDGELILIDTAEDLIHAH